jgi:hypothetical protein
MRRRGLTSGDSRFYILGLFALRAARHSQTRLWHFILQTKILLCLKLENLCLQKKNVLRRNTMLTIPLAIVAASMSAAVYIAFGWRPPEPKRVRLFFYEVESSKL